MRTQRKKSLRHPPVSTFSSPLYQRMIQLNALSSLHQRGTDLRRFRNAAEGLGYNYSALKDLYNYELDEPISHWRMLGCEHSSFEGFVEYLVCSGRKKHFQWGAASLVSPAFLFLGIMDVTHKVRRVSPGRWKLVSSLPDPQLISARAAGITPMVSNPVREPSESTPQPAPVREPTESAQEHAPVQETTEFAPVREPTESSPGAHRLHSSPGAHRVQSRSPQTPLQSGSPLQSPLQSGSPQSPL